MMLARRQIARMRQEMFKVSAPAGRTATACPPANPGIVQHGLDPRAQTRCGLRMGAPDRGKNGQNVLGRNGARRPRAEGRQNIGGSGRVPRVRGRAGKPGGQRASRPASVASATVGLASRRGLHHRGLGMVTGVDRIGTGVPLGTHRGRQGSGIRPPHVGLSPAAHVPAASTETVAKNPASDPECSNLEIKPVAVGIQPRLG